VSVIYSGGTVNEKEYEGGISGNYNAPMNKNFDLIDGWCKCNLESPPYLFPDDKLEIVNSHASIYLTFDDYIMSSAFGESSDTKLHIGLLPLPYVGNLAQASIFILMLNPGLSPGDYFAEQHNREFREAHIRNLRQENASDDYPFFCLDPRFSWHPGFGYWQKKFHIIIEALSKQSKKTYQQAMCQLAQSLAGLELLPYHSKSFGAGSLLHSLPSTQAMLAFVHEILLPKVEDDRAIIIATRGGKNWQLPKHKNIIVYEGSETRSAYLTLNTRGGNTIASHLGL